MMKEHIDQASAVPWWAAFGAPLIGVPLMILLLALSAPGDVVGTEGGEVEAGYVTEKAEIEAIGASIDVPPEYIEDDANSRC